MPDTETKSPFVSGFVSLLGRPNAGKSTLLNALVGAKVAIVSEKPQTTRTLIQGVLTLPNAQAVFMDTPGIHKGDTRFNRRMMEAVRSALEDRDLLLFLVDSALPFAEIDADAVEALKGASTPAMLVLNKIDRLKDKRDLLPLIEKYKELHQFVEFLPVSATTGEGLDALRKAVVERLPEGPAYFPPDYITDQPERFIFAELIREKLVRETRQEIPHAIAVIVDKWEETPKITRVSATIYVEREGQKGIVIGSRGAMLKRIGTLAREEAERLLDKKFFLELFVKVRPDWRENPEFLNELDWRSMVGES